MTSSRYRRSGLALVVMLGLGASLPFLLAQVGPSGGLPSKPRFQAVGVGVAPPAVGNVYATGALNAGSGFLGADSAGGFQGASASPYLRFAETDVALDQKMWTLSPSGSAFRILTRTDANGVGETALNITRTGTNVDAIALAADVVTINGATVAAPMFELKAADTSRASTTTATDDPDLTFTLASGVTYTVDGLIIASSTSATPDLKFQWTRPTITTGVSRLNYLTVEAGVGVVPASASQAAWSAIPVVPLTVNNFHGIQVTGSITTTASGTFALAWAQNTSDVAGTVLRAGSWLRVTPVN